MSERTPKPETVKVAWARAHRLAGEHAEFDRMVARVQAEAQVKVLRELASRRYISKMPGMPEYLRGSADRIAREAGIETGEKNDG